MQFDPAGSQTVAECIGQLSQGCFIADSEFLFRPDRFLQEPLQQGDLTTKLAAGLTSSFPLCCHGFGLFERFLSAFHFGLQNSAGFVALGL
jgi:hypothetical protein